MLDAEPLWHYVAESILYNTHRKSYYYKEKTKDINQLLINTSTWERFQPCHFSHIHGFFQSFFYWGYLVIKTQIFNWVSKFNLPSFSFQQLISNIFHWNCQRFILSTSSTRRAFQKRVYFQYFLLCKCVFQQFSGFQITKFLQLFLGYHEVLSVSITKISNNYKTNLLSKNGRLKCLEQSLGKLQKNGHKNFKKM